MPELPEVETIVRQLGPLLTGRMIEKVTVRLPRIIRGDLERFKRVPVGRRIEAVRRTGKNIFIDLTGGRTLFCHLKMTGHFDFRASPCGPDSRAKVSFDLDGGPVLEFHDTRTFGFMGLAETSEVPDLPHIRELGPDALTVSVKELRGMFAGRSRNVKATILDQNIIAGLGNIYADESLYRAGIHPGRPAGSLTLDETARLSRAIKSTLRAAIKAGGATIRDHVDPDGRIGYFQLKLRIYGRAGQPCRGCGQTIVKTRLAGRGTHYCPQCQRS